MTRLLSILLRLAEDTIREHRGNAYDLATSTGKYQHCWVGVVHPHRPTTGNERLYLPLRPRRQGPRHKPYDPNTDSTRQEMRSFVCGQCHVEYYFQAGSKLVTYPWHKGLKAEQIEAYYDQSQFKDKEGQTGRFYDWQHKTTAAKVLKAQHPEFELWSQGIHARSGVSCADCHMPYLREGAVKVSSHHVRSPLLTIAASCQVCHRYAEGELKARIETIQDRTKALMDRSLDALTALIADLAEAQKSSLPPERLDTVQSLQRRAQWRIDYINAENSMGFPLQRRLYLT